MSSAKFCQCFRDRRTLLKHIIRVGTTLRTATDCLAQEWQHLRGRSTQGRLFFTSTTYASTPRENEHSWTRPLGVA